MIDKKPKINLFLNKEDDLEFFLAFLEEDNRAILSDLKYLEEYKEKEKIEKEAKKYIFDYYKKNNDSLEQKLIDASERWREVEDDFLKEVNRIFKGYDWPEGEYIGNASILEVYPRIIEEKHFLFPINKPGSSSKVIAHEMLHFITYDYLERKYNLEPKEYHDEDRLFWEFTEAFNLLLENEKYWREIVKFKETKKLKPYNGFGETYEKMEKLWNKNKDIDYLIKKVFKIN